MKDGEVQFPHDQGVLQRVGIALGDAQLYAGAALCKIGQYPGQHGGTQVMGDAQVYAPGAQAAHVGELRLQLAVSFQNAGGALDVLLPGIGQPEPGRAALEECDAQLRFQAGNGLAERGLRHEEPPGSGGDGAFLGDGGDVNQFAVGHRNHLVKQCSTQV